MYTALIYHLFFSFVPSPSRRTKSGRGEEAEGGEEALSPAKAKLPADRRRAQGEEGTLCFLFSPFFLSLSPPR